jgi:hypothetical protein
MHRANMFKPPAQLLRASLLLLAAELTTSFLIACRAPVPFGLTRDDPREVVAEALEGMMAPSQRPGDEQGAR